MTLAILKERLCYEKIIYYFKDGKKFTGNGVDGNGKRLFDNGKYANGIYEGKLYKDGVVSKGKVYAKGIFYDENRKAIEIKNTLNKLKKYKEEGFKVFPHIITFLENQLKIHFFNKNQVVFTRIQNNFYFLLKTNKIYREVYESQTEGSDK